MSLPQCMQFHGIVNWTFMDKFQWNLYENNEQYAFENDDCKIYWPNMLWWIYVKFSLCYGLGFPISSFQKSSRLHFGVSRINIGRILGTYSAIKPVNMSEYAMQTTVSSQHQSKSVPTAGCFAHLLRARAEFMALCDGGNCHSNQCLKLSQKSCRSHALNLRSQT